METERKTRTPDLAHLEELASRVAARSAEMMGLDQEALSARFSALQRCGPPDGRSDVDDAARVELFALVGETARRVLGETPFETQIMAGLALDAGSLIEMGTGEGKTLAAVAPVVRRALSGDGVHVLTYNDYLAERDAAWMGPIYESLGLSVGCVTADMSRCERKLAYASHVTYLTVKEAGFDCLRDGLCLELHDQVQREFANVLVDEADSLMIDEARIPLVIAGHEAGEQRGLGRLAELARRLRVDQHWATDEHARNIFLTEEGVAFAERTLHCGNLFAPENARLQAELRHAVHAEVLLRRDVDYLVRNDKVELVDELTGRVAVNRQWPDGLQAAVLAKEGVSSQADGRILGSITVQHLLQRYRWLCGMTATAETARDELRAVYGLEVVSIPPHRPCARVDQDDVLFADAFAKRRRVQEEIATVHAAGRPILVGTASVEESEGLAADLAGRGLECRVLNARHDAREAEIVAEAGAPSAITIATNMAGRGTDIRLGGSTEAKRDEVVNLGGLYVLGTNRHESRRIDDQLRGRAGRQGDPGTTRFFISLEDPLLRRYGIEGLLPKKLRAALAADPALSSELDSAVVRREVERAQRIIEGEHADVRARLLRFAHLIERQRLELEKWRQAVLEGRPKKRLLPQHSRWQELEVLCGEQVLAGIERRLTLIAIDRCWSEHLEDMQALRDEVHLVTLDGRDPVTEFYRTAQVAFEDMISRIDQQIDETFERIEVTADGVDWERAGLTGPSATWTYLVNDNVFGGNTFLALSNRASIGMWAVLVLWPVLLAWGLMEHLKRRLGRRGSSSTRSESN